MKQLSKEAQEALKSWPPELKKPGGLQSQLESMVPWDAAETQPGGTLRFLEQFILEKTMRIPTRVSVEGPDLNSNRGVHRVALRAGEGMTGPLVEQVKSLGNGYSSNGNFVAGYCNMGHHCGGTADGLVVRAAQCSRVVGNRWEEPKNYCIKVIQGSRDLKIEQNTFDTDQNRFGVGEATSIIMDRSRGCYGIGNDHVNMFHALELLNCDTCNFTNEVSENSVSSLVVFGKGTQWCRYSGRVFSPKSPVMAEFMGGNAKLNYRNRVEVFVSDCPDIPQWRDRDGNLQFMYVRGPDGTIESLGQKKLFGGYKHQWAIDQMKGSGGWMCEVEN